MKLLAADGETDIYGLVFRPSNFSPDRQYPVIDFGFATPEAPIVPKGSFSNGVGLGFSYMIPAAYAELGFIVVMIDTRGTAYRSRAFHDFSYGWVPSASYIPDRIAGIRQLAERYPYMDLERVGAVGAPASVSPLYSLLEHPDFYKVGVAYGGAPDARLMPAFWTERYEGPSHKAQDPRQAEYLVENLQGKLLMIHGMLDPSCTPTGTFRLVEALQQANKDFDMLLMPNLGHDVTGYLQRRIWDYVVRYLSGAEPPKEFKLTTSREN